MDRGGEIMSTAVIAHPVIFMFAGQGSQSYHMGRELFAHVPEFRCRLLELDQLAQRALGFSILDIVFDKERSRYEPFNNLLHSNAALYIVQVCLAQTLISLGVRPGALMGASMGEIIAMTLAESIRVEDGLLLVIAMSKQLEHTPATGGLLAIIAPPDIVQRRRALFDGAEIAGVLSKEHFILAGSAIQLKHISSVLEPEGIACLLLPVGYPFHSSLLEHSQAKLGSLLNGRLRGPLALPVISCVSGQCIDEIAHDHLWQIVRQPMRVSAAFAHMNTRPETIWIDLSPSGTMATVAKYNLPPASTTEIYSIMSLMGNEVEGFDSIRKHLKV
jgi:malonyl CoA-acyl carrier protein transacylase